MEGDENHSGEGDVFPPGTLIKKRSREEDRNEEEENSQTEFIQSSKKTIKVSPQEESEILDWFKEHRELCAKKSAKYLDTAYKARIINAQADEMGISGETYSEMFWAYQYLIQCFVFCFRLTAKSKSVIES